MQFQHQQLWPNYLVFLWSSYLVVISPLPRSIPSLQELQGVTYLGRSHTAWIMTFRQLSCPDRLFRHHICCNYYNPNASLNLYGMNRRASGAAWVFGYTCSLWQPYDNIASKRNFVLYAKFPAFMICYNSKHFHETAVKCFSVQANLSDNFELHLKKGSC